MDWKWKTEAKECLIEEKRITMVAGSGTNLFNSPSGYFKCNDFPYLYQEYEGDFIAKCKVSVDFMEEYDLAESLFGKMKTHG